MPEPQTVLLHVGCRKSGTSTLQLGLRRAADHLRTVGLDQPLGGRGGIVAGLTGPLARAAEGDEPAAREALAALADRVRSGGSPRSLVSLEALAELPASSTSLVVEALREFDLRVVVTARPWALTVPSEWQQRVKSRSTIAYDDYAAAVVDPSSASGEAAREAADFRRRQDLADVVARWRAADPALPVDVVLVPQDRQASPGLVDLFAEVVGVSPEDLAVPDRYLNESLSHQDAEALRLVNLALGDRLQDLRGDYRYGVRKHVAVGAMMKGGSQGTKIRLPAALEAWASEESARQLEALRAGGCRVLGDVDGFLRPALRGDDFVPATDAEVARAAAAALAELAQQEVRRRRQEKRRRKQRRAAGRGGAPGPTPARDDRGLAARARRALSARRA